jgi:putative endonuclease
MIHYVYIMYSGSLDRYYTGNTVLHPDERLAQHNSAYNKNSYTTKGMPWKMFLVLECDSREQARKVELHIKKMKSKQYILNLNQYPEMRKKLLNRYK